MYIWKWIVLYVYNITMELHQPEPQGEACKIQCFCLPRCQKYDAHQIHFRLKLMGKIKKKNLYNFNHCKSVGKSICKMELGVTFLNPSEQGSPCSQQDLCLSSSWVDEHRWMGFWAFLWGHLWWESWAASYQHHVVPPPTAAMRTPSPQVFLLSLNVLIPQGVRSKSQAVRFALCHLFFQMCPTVPVCSGLLMPLLCSEKSLIHRACFAWCGAAASRLSSFLLGHRVRQQHGLGSAHKQCVCREMK